MSTKVEPLVNSANHRCFHFYHSITNKSFTLHSGICQGKTTNFPEDTEKENLRTGERAVMSLSESCQAGTNLYFDRYGICVALLVFYRRNEQRCQIDYQI